MHDIILIYKDFLTKAKQSSSRARFTPRRAGSDSVAALGSRCHGRSQKFGLVNENQWHVFIGTYWNYFPIHTIHDHASSIHHPQVVCKMLCLNYCSGSSIRSDMEWYFGMPLSSMVAIGGHHLPSSGSPVSATGPQILMRRATWTHGWRRQRKAGSSWRKQRLGRPKSQAANELKILKLPATLVTLDSWHDSWRFN